MRAGIIAEERLAELKAYLAKFPNSKMAAAVKSEIAYLEKYLQIDKD